MGKRYGKALFYFILILLFSLVIGNASLKECEAYMDVKNECDSEYGGDREDYITPEQFGAVGNGIIDDTKALQDTFKYACKNDGITIRFGKEKNYLINGGIVLPKTSVVEGNNSIISIKKISSFTAGGNFRNQFFSEYYYNTHSYLLDWKDVTIDFSPELLLNEDGTVKEYMLFRFYDLDCFRMNNVTIVSNGDERNNINLLKFEGHGEIYIDNCTFNIKHRGKVGSILWIQSKIADGYYARINNSLFYSTCWDEIISMFCNGAHDVIFDNCTIVKSFYDTYYNKYQTLEVTTGPFLNTVYQTPKVVRENEIEHIVTFKNSSLVCKPINDESKVYITFCGLNSYYGDKATTNFIDCNISAYNISNLVGGDQYNDGQCITNITDSTKYHEKIKAIFDNCRMNLKVGAYGIMQSNSSNAEIRNCIITTNRLINYVWANVRTVTSYRLDLINNEIIITGDDKSLFIVNRRTKEKYNIVGNKFITLSNMNGKSASFLSLKDTDDGYSISVFPHVENAKFYFNASKNYLNGKAVSSCNISK